MQEPRRVGLVWRFARFDPPGASRSRPGRGTSCILLAGLLLAAALTAGCGGAALKTSTRRAIDAIPPKTPLSAYVYRDRLILRFQEGDKSTIFDGNWKARGLEAEGENRFRAVTLTLVEKLPKDVEEIRRSAREAAIAPREAFRALAPEVAKRLVPSVTDEGVFLGVREKEYVIYRDAAGEAILVAAAQAPANVRIVREINITEFARVVFEVLEEKQRAAGDPRRLFLSVDTSQAGPPVYIVFDLDQKVVVLATYPGTADVATEKMSSGKFWRVFEAGILEGQVLALVKNPVSFVGRALNFAFETLAVIFRKRSWPAPEIVPVITEGPGMDLPAFEARLDKKLGSNRYKGSIRLLLDGPGFFPVFEKRIAEAKESIHFRVCIWDTDDVAVDLADRVRQQSLVIPDTRVLVDRITTQGSGGAPPGTPMREGFEPPAAIQPYLRKDSRVRVRNFLNAMTMGDHSKVYLIDRKYAYLGGMNVGREYRYEWHDAMVELEGPIVGWFERDFELAWSHASVLGDLAYAEAYLTAKKTFEGPAESPDYVELRPIYSKTLNPTILRAVREALKRARRYAWIENPYIYDDDLVRAAIAARRRGVDVRVVMPSQADMASTDSNNKVKANRMIQNGIRVYSYPGMLHTKAAVIDGWSIIGSCNFNKLSLRTNFEADVATSDPKFAEEMRRDLFEADFERSKELKELLPLTDADRIAEWMVHQM